MRLEEKKKLALQQDINQLLQAMGYSPVKNNGNETWYHSPFRPKEEKPSFHVSKGTYLHSIWNDFGLGAERSGGNIIHLVRLLKSYGYAESIDFILSMTSGNSVIHSKHKFAQLSGKTKLPKPDRYILKEIKSIENPGLFDYLIQRRKLTKPVITSFLKEVHFQDTHTEKDFFAPGILNEKGGFEVNNQFRNISFKSAVPGSSKSISFIPSTKNMKEVLVFEGFFDALSYLVDNELEQFPSSVIIMNSASLEGETVRLILEKGYSRVFAFFDNDARGNELSDSFQRRFGNEFKDCSLKYASFKDYNEYLQHRTTKITQLDFGL